MATPPETATPFQQDVTKLTKPQKLAALLVMLGQEGAAQILRGIDEHEVEAISIELAKIDLVSQKLQQDILKEFSTVAVEAAASLRGGVDYTQATLEKAVGLFKAAHIVSRVAPSRTPVAAMKEIVDVDVRQIFNLLKLEQPQTVAMILSYLPPDKAAQVLFMLRSEMRDQVVERLATLAPTPIEVVEKVVEVINHKTGVKRTRALNHTGGLKSAAAVLNAMEKNSSKTILLALEQRNPELVLAIQQKMFTFEDLATLEASALQRILREVDLRELAIALKSSSDKLKTALLSCISKRAAETVNEEIAFMGPLKLKDIEATQTKIIEIVRRLESEGEIDLGSS